MQVLQSAPGELGSGAANRSVNPELICPPYILWTRRVRAGSDPSSPIVRPIIAQSQPSLPEQHPLSPDPIPVVRCCVPIVARFFLNSRTRRRELSTRRRALRTRRRDPSRARPAPVCASPISMCAFSHFSTLCQSIPARTSHGDFLRDSPRCANYFSSHVIHHH